MSYFSIDHQPPLGNIEHGHHIITFNFSNLKTNIEDRDLGEMLFYQKGKYRFAWIIIPWYYRRK